MASASDLSGRVVLVTGAAAGLGRAHALWFARHGAMVVANNRVHPGRPEGAAGVVAEITAAGGRAIADGHDIATAGAGAAMVGAALAAFGRIDAVVANAAVDNRRHASEVTVAELREGMEVNFWGSVEPVMAALPHMLAQDFGRIVLTCSAAALATQRERMNYAAAKMAIVGFGRGLAYDTAKTGVRVNIVSPYARTNMSKGALGEETEALMSPDHVARVVGWLASEACTITGQIIAAGGGRIRRNAIVEGPIARVEGEDVAAAWEQVATLSTISEPRNSAWSSVELVPELRK